MATALIRPLAWEPPYAMGVAQEMAKRQKKKKKDKGSCGKLRRKENYYSNSYVGLHYNISVFDEVF